MSTFLLFFLTSVSVTHALAEPASEFKPKNGCTISGRTTHKSSNGIIFYGVMVESYDNEGLDLEKKKSVLLSEKSSISAKKTKTQAERSRLKELEKLVLKASENAKSHRIKAFWPEGELARGIGSNEKFPAACPKMVVENGKPVLNPESKLRASCIRHGLDLPSVPEIEALFSCFQRPSPLGRPVFYEDDHENLKRIVPPMKDLYFATKDVNKKASSDYFENIHAYSVNYIQGVVNDRMDSSEYLAIQCMDRIKK
jgi:hypothetical protein